MIKGVDVSYWEGKMDFSKAFAQGVQFEYAKASQGTWVDSTFYYNHLNAKNNGLRRGVFHFLDWNYTPTSQAQKYYLTIKDDLGELEPCVDFEWNLNIPTPSSAFRYLYDFLEEFKRLSKLNSSQVAIYTNINFWKDALLICRQEDLALARNKDYWNQYKLWICKLGENLPTDIYPWDDWYIWQYSFKGDARLHGSPSAKDIDLDYMKEKETFMENLTPVVSLYTDDLSVQSPIVDFDLLASEGAEGFLLRLCGSIDGIAPWKDQKYPELYLKAKATGRAVGAVIKLHPKYDEQSYNNETLSWYLRAKTGMDLIRESVGSSYIPDFFVISDETPSWKSSTGAVVNCTPSNHLNALKTLAEALYEKYKKTVFIFSAEWVEKTYFDKAQGINFVAEWASRNCTEENERFPLILYSGHNTGQIISDFTAYTISIAPPTPDEEKVNLYCGNAKWRGWEQTWFKSSAIGNGTFLARLDLMRCKVEDFYKNYCGKVYTKYNGSTPEVPNDPPPADSTVISRLEKLEAFAKVLSNIFKGIQF